MGEKIITKNELGCLRLVMSMLFILSFIGLVSGANAITLVAPAEDGGVKGSTFLINTTLDTNAVNYTFADFFFDDGSSNTTIANGVKNYSDVSFNYSWDTTGVDDVNNITVWVRAYNLTVSNTNTTDLSTGVDLDNGDPTATLGNNHFATLTKVSSSDSFVVSLSADDTIGYNSCRIFFTNARTNNVENITILEASANVCSNTITLSDVGGLTIGDSFIVVVQAEDDNTNKTNSSDRILVTSSTSGSPVTITTGTPQVSVTSKITNSIVTPFKMVGDFFSNLINKILGVFRGFFN